MTVETSSRLLQWFIKYFSTGNDEVTRPIGPFGCIIYEMFGLNDSFGKVMLTNLQVSKCALQLTIRDINI